MRKLLEEGVLIQGIVTVGLIGSMIYLWVTNQTIPNELYAFGSLILGFWFGTKSQYQINKIARVG